MDEWIRWAVAALVGGLVSFGGFMLRLGGFKRDVEDSKKATGDHARRLSKCELQMAGILPRLQSLCDRLDSTHTDVREIRRLVEKRG